MRQQKSNKGFTLIELLIVIAIIGILAAVLIPNLLSARKRAYETEMQAYLREVATTQEMLYIDGNTYGDWAAVNGSADSPTKPANVTQGAGSGSTADYCVDVTHTGVTGVTYRATPGGGIEKLACGA